MTNSTDPLISVIIPVYNMGEFVEQALRSVLDGDYERLEVLVVDDGSVDNTKQVIEQFVTPGNAKYDDRVQYIGKPNEGKSTAVNLGLSRYLGDYLMILDADDELTASSLRCRSAIIQSFGREKSMAIGGFEVFETDVAVGVRPVPQNMSANRLMKKFYFSLKTPFHLNSCLISRSLVDAVGLFDESLMRCQDIDYSIRCLQKTQLLETCDDIVYRYRKHRSSRADRIRFRLRTTKHRSKVFRKNFTGFQKVIMVVGSVAMDMLKLAFEIFGNFKR